MLLIRWCTSRVPAVAAMLALTAGGAEAQQRALFTWSGQVDREVHITMRGRDVDTRGAGMDGSFRPHINVREALPRTNGYVTVGVSDGRGSAEVVQQPSSANGYVTVIRIRDPQGGQDNYSLVTAWNGNGGGGYGGGYDDDCYDDRRDNGRGNGRYDNNGRGNGRSDNNGRGNGNGRDDNRGNDRYDRDCDRRDRDDRGGWDNDRRDRRDNDRWDDRRDRDRRDDDRWGNGRNNDNGVLSWRGDVDGITEIRISGRQVSYSIRSGQNVRNVRYDIDGSGLPRRDIPVHLGVQQSRGQVQVIQQPSRSNGYTAVVRVNDPRSGYGSYGFNLRW